jgi:hypothetical protein
MKNYYYIHKYRKSEKLAGVERTFTCTIGEVGYPLALNKLLHIGTQTIHI